MKRLTLLLSLIGFSLIAHGQSGLLVRHITGHNGQPDQYPNGFRKPHDLTLGPNGQLLYIADTDNDVIQVWHAQTMKPVAVIGRGELRRPLDVSFDRHGRLWVADSGNGRLVSYDVSKPIARRLKVIERNIQRPEGIGFDRHGRLLIVDAQANQLLVMLVDQGIIIQRIGNRGSAAGEFNRPRDVVVDRSGLIYVSDPGNHRVQLFSPELHFIKAIHGTAERALRQPSSLATDAQQRLYITDELDNRVVVLDAALNLVWQIGGRGSNLPLRQPQGIAAADGQIWITDSGHHRLIHLSHKSIK
jgi:DNA-binding beta-propeller fold protein YncE